MEKQPSQPPTRTPNEFFYYYRETQKSSMIFIKW